MSDKKEIATLSIKVSVDSTDLDKLEAQLKRIEGLMISTGLKQPAKGGFIVNPFVLKNGQVFIDKALIPSGIISSIKIQGPAIDDALRRAAKEGAKDGFLNAITKIETEDQRRIKALELAVERLTSAIQSAKSGWL